MRFASRSRASSAHKVRDTSQRAEALRIPKLRGRAPSDKALDDNVFASWEDELWHACVWFSHALEGRKRFYWELTFPRVAAGSLTNRDSFGSAKEAVADVRRVLRRILGSST